MQESQYDDAALISEALLRSSETASLLAVMKADAEALLVAAGWAPGIWRAGSTFSSQWGTHDTLSFTDVLASVQYLLTLRICVSPFGPEVATDIRLAISDPVASANLAAITVAQHSF